MKFKVGQKYFYIGDVSEARDGRYFIVKNVYFDHIIVEWTFPNGVSPRDTPIAFYDKQSLKNYNKEWKLDNSITIREKLGIK